MSIKRVKTARELGQKWAESFYLSYSYVDKIKVSDGYEHGHKIATTILLERLQKWVKKNKIGCSKVENFVSVTSLLKELDTIRKENV
jgi:hypothetical protein